MTGCVKFRTQAAHWGGSLRGGKQDGSDYIVTIELSAGVLYVDGQPVKMSYNGIQLRFDLKEGRGCYIIFDNGTSCHQHNPPKPIIEMYKDLGGRRKGISNG